MEVIYYKCGSCGFVHQVPSYWSGHAPEKSLELMHINLNTKEMCLEVNLTLIEE